jgi:hypothetical protein
VYHAANPFAKEMPRLATNAYIIAFMDPFEWDMVNTTRKAKKFELFEPLERLNG